MTTDVDPLKVKATPGNLAPGFTTHPEKWWIEITGGTPAERQATLDRAMQAARAQPRPPAPPCPHGPPFHGIDWGTHQNGHCPDTTTPDPKERGE